MAFELLAESFGRYKVANFNDASLHDNFQQRYTTLNLDQFCEITSTEGRTGNGIVLAVGGRGFTKTMSHTARWVTGVALKFTTGTSPGSTSIFYTVLNNDTVLFRVGHDADGTLSLYAGNNPIPFAVTTRALLDERYYYIEADVTFSGSTPITATGELRINGHVEASGSGSTSVNASSLLSNDTTANVHSFAAPGNTGSRMVMDDLYIKNAAGYYGDIRIIALFPDGDGATLQWTPNSGTVHFDRVNTHPEDLTKWLQDLTAGHIDTWNWQDCPGFSGTIKAVNISALARKDDEGTKSFEIVVGNTGTEAHSPEFFVSDATPEYYEYSLETDPATGLAWTQVGYNAKQFGIKLIS